MTERDIFIAALQMEGLPQRQAYLDEACAGQPGLRAQIEELLRLQENAGSFLEGQAALEATGAFTPSPGHENAHLVERPGSVVGSYKLLEQIGEGGFGMVFMAEQQEPVRRRVALKVLKPGMGSGQVVARFEAERQALALMDHPNIAQVHDGGTTEQGRPFFVMELVKGVPITDFCDQAQLTTTDRAELFVSVCSAVQHAHQKGVIHRDIKPSNLLVTQQDGRAVVKVIDFGIAKALEGPLTNRTLFTGFAQMIGTPLYMSPEQAALSNVDVDTRSDVYSLGVLLYELLTGTTPFTKERLQQAGYDEMRRIIREEEPPRPSSRISTMGQAATTVSNQRKSDPKRLSQLCRGELDWIVMKALEKDRNRRYESASAFAADVQRFLNDQPVLACPPSLTYRCRKFVRRNRRALTTLAVVGATLLLAVGLVAGNFSRAARDRAEHQSRAARERAERQAKLRAEVEAAALEADRAGGRARGLTNQPAQWQAALAEAMSALRRAEALASSDKELLGPELGNRLRALADRLRADERDWALITTTEQALMEENAPAPTGVRLSRSAAPKYREAFAAYGARAATTPVPEVAALIHGRPPAIQHLLIAALDNWLVKPGRTPEEALWLRAVLVAADPDDWRNQMRAAFLKIDTQAVVRLSERPEVLQQPPATLSHWGWELILTGHPSSLRLLRRAQERYPGDFLINAALARALGEANPPQLKDAVAFARVALALRPDNGVAHNNLGVALERSGDVEGAIARYRRATELAPKFATAYSNLGFLLRAKKDLKGAASAYRKALEVVASNDPSSAPSVATIHNDLGLVLADQGNVDGAIASYRKAIQLDPKLAAPHINLGNRLKARGDLEGAIASYRKAIELDAKKEPDEKKAAAHYNLGVALGERHKRAGRRGARQDLDESIACLQKAIDIDKTFAPAYSDLCLGLQVKGDLPGAVAAGRKAVELGPKDHRAHLDLGNALAAQKELVEAIACFLKAIKLDPTYALAHHNLASALKDRGDLKGAIASYRESVRLNPKDANAHLNLGQALKATKDLEGAIASYRKALGVDPNFASAHNNLGLALTEKNELVEAIACLQKAIALEPESWSPHLNLGNALRARGDREGALAAYHKAVKLAPKQPLIHNSLGAALLDRGDVDRAIAAFRKAIELRPKYAEAHSNLGSALARKNNLNGAIDHYRKAISLDPALVAAHFNLGNALMRKRDLDGAIAAFRAAAAGLAPRRATIRSEANFRRNLARSQHALGALLYNSHRLKDAEAAYKDALASLKQLPGELAKQPRSRRDLALCHNSLGNVFYLTGRPKEAEAAYREALTHLKKLVAEAPSAGDLNNELAGALVNLGMIYDQRRELTAAVRFLDQALPYHQAALKASPGSANYRLFYRNNLLTRAQCHLGLADHARLARAADELARLAYDPANDTSAAACFLGRCAIMAGKDTQVEAARRKELARGYADRALALLRLAFERGYRNTAHLQKSPDLEPLRGRPELEKLLADLARKAKK
jgi:tetratricopeptide (TPR) repeat protein/serine/threonine protein kinase